MKKQHLFRAEGIVEEVYLSENVDGSASYKIEYWYEDGTVKMDFAQEDADYESVLADFLNSGYQVA